MTTMASILDFELFTLPTRDTRIPGCSTQFRLPKDVRDAGVGTIPHPHPWLMGDGTDEPLASAGT